MLKFSYPVKSVLIVCAFFSLSILMILSVDHWGAKPNFPVFSNLYAHQAVMRHKTQLATLNFFIPDFTNLAEFQKNGHPLDRDQWENYQNYYLKVREVMPNLPEIYSLIGTCAYYMGNSAQAIDFYQKSIKQNPGFFWSYYDLGVLMYKNGRIQEALSILILGLQTDPIKNFSHTALSPIFRQIFPSINKDGIKILDDIKSSLEKGYNNEKILANLCCYKINKCPKPPSDNLSLDALEPKIF